MANARLRHRIADLEDRNAAQKRDLQTLITDNQRLASSHVALKQDLAAARHDLRLLSDSAARFKTDGDAELRGLYDRAVGAEEVRRVEALREEAVAMREDLGKLGNERDALAERVAEMKAEMGKVEEAKVEMGFLRREIERGRDAVEYEKKVYVENIEQSNTMEKNMVIMVRELERLRAELVNAEKRAQAATAAAAAAATKQGQGYTKNYGDNGMPYGGNT